MLRGGDAAEFRDGQDRKRGRYFGEPGSSFELSVSELLTRVGQIAGPEFIQNPRPELYEDCSPLGSANPFQTYAYSEARRSQGDTAWLFCVTDIDGQVHRVAAFSRRGFCGRVLEIPSVPDLLQPSVFTEAVEAFCRKERITRCSLESFGSTDSRCIQIGSDFGSRCRAEYVLNLGQPELVRTFSRTHRERVQKAKKAGAVLIEATEPGALQCHTNLFLSSMGRRLERGEAVPEAADVCWLERLVLSGAAKLFQVAVRDQVVASKVVIFSKTEVYSYSTGISDEGRKIGASHFLIAAIAEHFAALGYRTFNIGGARESETGLSAYKASFGGKKVELQSAEYALGGRCRKLQNLVETVLCWEGPKPAISEEISGPRILKLSKMPLGQLVSQLLPFGW